MPDRNDCKARAAEAMPMPFNVPTSKLPDSTAEIQSLVLVGLIAALAALARLLYGKDEMSWRYTLGALLVAMVTAIMVYGFLASYFPIIGGHASAGIGAAVGLFTDDVLKRARDQVKSMKFPTTKSSD